MIRTIVQKKDWEEYLTLFKASFLQSWDWGEILTQSGQKIERIVIENDNATMLALIVFKKLPAKKIFAFIPFGPVTDKMNENNWRELIGYIRSKGVVFLKIEPTNLAIVPEFVKQKMQAVKDVNPMATMVLPLEKDAVDILRSFHQKTRYNINLAEKKNLVIKWEKNFSAFWGLMKKTGSRDGFALHPEKNYQAAVENPSVKQVTIYFDNKPIAAGCFWISQGTCYYLYGASDHEYRQLMAPYLVQWEAVKMAKENGCRFYDFFGIAPRKELGSKEYEYDPKHRYAGVTRFKLGFNGMVAETPGTFNISINSFWYKLYCLSRRLRGLQI